MLIVNKVARNAKGVPNTRARFGFLIVPQEKQPAAGKYSTQKKTRYVGCIVTPRAHVCLIHGTCGIVWLTTGGVRYLIGSYRGIVDLGDDIVCWVDCPTQVPFFCFFFLS